MRIADGTPESHPTPLPLDASVSPGVAPPTPTVGLLAGPTYAAADTVGQQAERLDGYEADLAAAQSAGMGAREAMLAHYGADILPLGAAYGDPVDLPPVPANTLPPAASDLYPWSGQEPVEAAADVPNYPNSAPV